MHAGNLAFWLTDPLPFRLAPAYDMLPMLWAPGPQGEIMPRRFTPTPPTPENHGPWSEAFGWAADFWERVAGDGELSPEFARIAQEAQAATASLKTRL